MTRHERIYHKLDKFAALGIISDTFTIQNMMPNKRYLITPFGFTERAFSTNEVEYFIMGIDAALAKEKENAYVRAGM